jgi:uncharacterized protein YchJ
VLGEHHVGVARGAQIGMPVTDVDGPGEVRAQAETGDSATVEFVARCRVGGRAQRLHEISRFVREDGRWYYVDGVMD